jgi:hypothetical protein
VFIPLVKGRNYRATLVSSSVKEAEIPVSLTYLSPSPWNIAKGEISGMSGPFRVEGAGKFSYSFASAGTVLFASADEKQMKEAKLYPRSFADGSGWVLLTDRRGRPQNGTIRSAVANAGNEGFVAVADENPVGFVFSGTPALSPFCAPKAGRDSRDEAFAVSHSPLPAARSSVIRSGETVSAVYGGTSMVGCLWNALSDGRGESVRFPLSVTLWRLLTR